MWLGPQQRGTATTVDSCLLIGRGTTVPYQEQRRPPHERKPAQRRAEPRARALQQVHVGGEPENVDDQHGTDLQKIFSG